jgi:holliday junction DNA helicase RuvA
MIGKLTGVVDSVGDEWVIVDVGGVGYVVFCSRRTLTGLPAPGETVVLSIETHVREDHIHLYGFADTAERTWFRLLCTVQGVGARMALAILSVLSPAELAQVIVAQDKAAVARANGVGTKLATRVITELKEKAGKIAFAPAAGDSARVGAGAVPEDAVSALVNLGYRRAEAFGAVAHAARSLGSKAPLEAVIKAGLKELSA